MTRFCEEVVEKFPDVIDITDSKIEKLQGKLKDLLPKGMYVVQSIQKYYLLVCII